MDMAVFELTVQVEMQRIISIEHATLAIDMESWKSSLEEFVGGSPCSLVTAANCGCEVSLNQSCWIQHVCLFDFFEVHLFMRKVSFFK